jgi:Ca-activated chloride channel family protein
MPLAKADSHGRAELLPILWARSRVMRLSDMAGSEEAQHRDEILGLGLKYSLLTRFTSFIAVDEVVANPAGDAKDVTQPLPLPQGVSELALARPVPEPEVIWMLALLAAIAALSTRTRTARRHAIC